MSLIRLDEPLNTTSGAHFQASRLIASKQSAWQRIEIFDTPDLGKLMRIDGANMVSTRDEFFYHENLIHPATIAHPHPRDVLIIGGGDGGAAEEVLKHPSVARCVVCELDADVVALSKEYFHDVHRGVFDNPKLQLHIGDGLAYVREAQKASDRFDLIFLDLTDPSGAAAALYTQTFFTDCKKILAVDGTFTFHIGSPFSHPERVKTSIANIGTVFGHIAPYFVHIPLYGATWGFVVASDALNIAAIDAPTIDVRLLSRDIHSRQFYNGAMHHAMLALPVYVKALLG